MCDELKRTNPVKNVRFRVVFTSREGFPEHILKMADDLMEETKHIKYPTINILFGYGGHDEIALAAREMAAKVKCGKMSLDDINAESIASHLLVQEPLDCIGKHIAAFISDEISF